MVGWGGVNPFVQIMMRALSVSPLSDYGVWWSLGDSKYGGTALLVKHSCSPISISYSLDQSGALTFPSHDT